MIRFDIIDGGRFAIGKAAYQRGAVQFRVDASAVEARLRSTGQQLFQPVHYSQIINGGTGRPFASATELAIWIDGHADAPAVVPPADGYGVNNAGFIVNGYSLKLNS